MLRTVLDNRATYQCTVPSTLIDTVTIEVILDADPGSSIPEIMISHYVNLNFGTKSPINIP